MLNIFNKDYLLLYLGLCLSIIVSGKHCLNLILSFYSPLLHSFSAKPMSFILYVYNHLCFCLLSDAPVRL